MTTYFNEISVILQRSELQVLIGHYRGVEALAAEEQDYLAAHGAKLRANALEKMVDEAHD